MSALLRTTGALTLVVIAICGVCLWFWPVKGSADAAAWAQGISTSLAVIAALFVPAWQRLDARERDLKQRDVDSADRTETAFQLAFYVDTVCKKVLRHCQAEHHPDRNYLTNAAGELEAIGAAFDKYRPSDFSTYSELKPLISVMAARAALERHLLRALDRMDVQAVSTELLGAYKGAEDSIEGDVRSLRSAAENAKARAESKKPRV